MQQLTRRALLGRAAAAVAAATIAPDPRAATTIPSGPPRRRARRAVKLGMVAGGTTLAEKFRILADCGFHGVELDSPGDWKVDDVRAALRATGLEVPGLVDSVHWQKPFSAPEPEVRADGRKALDEALHAAKAVGASSVLVVPAVVNKNVSYLDAWARSRREIQQLVPLAKELGVQILIENVWNGFLLGPTELARYVDEFESDLVGIHFDAGNLVRFGFPEQWVPILGPRIKKVDVKDFDRKRNSFDVALNEGDADWPAIVRALRGIGYDGWYTAEMKGGDAAYLADLGKRMDSFLLA